MENAFDRIFGIYKKKINKLTYNVNDIQQKQKRSTK